jgi:spore maturation protein CgeB
MRIFYASSPTPNAWMEVPSKLWRDNLYLPLLDLGHEVVEFMYDYKKITDNWHIKDKNRDDLTSELMTQIRAAHSEKPIDLFFSYFYDRFVFPEAIDEIRNMGIKTVNWYCNGSYQLNLVSEISPHYDWCLVPEKWRINDYIQMGANPIYCQEAANPQVYRPHRVPLEFDVTFVGQRYGNRPQYIKCLLDHGIDIRVWGLGWQIHSAQSAASTEQPKFRSAMLIGRKLMTGQGWQAAAKSARVFLSRSTRHFGGASGQCGSERDLPPSILGGPLSDLEMIKMFSRSKINLGFSSCGETHQDDERILQIRLRDFEVPMSGGFYMVEYMEELEEFYEIGKEVVCYTGSEDLSEKIKYYLAHETERETIRKAGYERCLRDHTWHKRFQTVFQQMGLAD